jgi:hypothetical protein
MRKAESFRSEAAAVAGTGPPIVRCNNGAGRPEPGHPSYGHGHRVGGGTDSPIFEIITCGPGSMIKLVIRFGIIMSGPDSLPRL